MEIQVLFFARARELAGTDSARVELAAEAHVTDALAQVAANYPALGKYLANCRTAVDEEFVTTDAPLAENSVLAIIPPVSGGL